VSSRRIRTFDGHRYSVPLSDCWSVLAKDCSNSNRFAVLLKKISPSSSEKKLKILTHQHEIVLEKSGSEISIRKDGVSYTPEEAAVLYAGGFKVAKCFKSGPYVKCLLPLEGVSVYFDGYTVSIKVSQSYLGRQCGLCGHYDLEPENEFYGPELEPMEDARAFFLKYILKDGSCTVPTTAEEVCEEASCPYRPHYFENPSLLPELNQELSRRVYNPKTVEPKKLNKIIKKVGKTCFSKKAVPICPEYTYPAQGNSEDVEFVCMPTSEFKTSEIAYAAQYSPVPEVRQLATSFTKPVMIPSVCKKY
jgi:hypothetical protein